jgi:hypothetical protein
VTDSALALSLQQIDAVRDALGDEVHAWLEDPDLARKPLASMSDDELADIHGAACSALMNGGPIVRSYTARQDGTTYPVWIAGIEGVYLLMAPEHDPRGPFRTLYEAVDAMDRHHGKFLVGE